MLNKYLSTFLLISLSIQQGKKNIQNIFTDVSEIPVDQLPMQAKSGLYVSVNKDLLSNRKLKIQLTKDQTVIAKRKRGKKTKNQEGWIGKVKSIQNSEILIVCMEVCSGSFQVDN